MDKFSIEDKGYSIAEVNKFVDDVILQTESNLDKLRKSHEELENLRKEVSHYKEVENDLQTALQKAEQGSNDIRKSALQEKEVIINEARKNASRIVNDALLRAERAEIKAETLERNVRIFKKKLKLVVEQQLAVVEEIEDLHVDDRN